MKIAIDIDGVIDRIPEFLSVITPYLVEKKHEITILTSRSNSPEIIEKSLAEIKEANVHFTNYFFLPEANTRADSDFPTTLNWFERHLWQKAEYCQKNKIDIFFEDDAKTISLVQKHSPQTVCLKVC